MTISVKRYQELEAKVSRLQREQDRAEGALEEQNRRLKKDHDCDSISMAEKKLKKLDRKTAEAETAFEDSLVEFESEWGDKLKENER